MDILNGQAGIGLIEADWSPVRSRSEVNEFLEVLSAGRRWRVLCEFEYKVEDLPDVLREIGNVLFKGSVVDGKETNLVIFKRYELREVWCADAVQIFGGPVAARAAAAVVLRRRLVSI
jgi:hypothetical protein